MSSIVQEDHRLVGWNLESPPALGAIDRVVHPIQVIPQFLEHGLVARVAAARHAFLLLAQKPLHLVVVTMPTLWASQRHGLHFGELVEAVPFVQRHADIV